MKDFLSYPTVHEALSASRKPHCPSYPTVYEALSASRKKDFPSYSKVYEVLSTLVQMGPGLHSPSRITDACVQSISKASVERILQAGSRSRFLTCEDRPRGRLYGLPQGMLDGSDEDEPRLPVAEDGPLTQVCRVLQRRTGQVVTAYALCLVDTPASRLMRHHDFGNRDDFARDVDQDPATLEVLEHAPLLRASGRQDAATLLLLAHLNIPKSNRLRLIRSEGHALTPSPVEGWQTLAAPLRHGRTVTGALSIHARSEQMDRHLSTYIHQLTNCAADLSEYVDHSSALAA